MTPHICIVIPIYNDADSLSKLLPIMAASLSKIEADYSLLVVNDGSSLPQTIITPKLFRSYILHLRRNIGHQKAITIGLAWVNQNLPCDYIIVMDGDGEDRPEDVANLANKAIENPGKIIFGSRSSRQEGNKFLFLYLLYKILFRVLTGRRISFGNFLILPFQKLKKLVYYSEIWNHVASGIIKSGLTYTSIDTYRGKRLAGSSKMDLKSLLIHGLAAISVFIDVIATRLLVISLLLILFATLSILAILAIRLLTDLAIPGWTSIVISAMLIVLLQGLLLSLFIIFLYLTLQSQRKFIPALHYRDYTDEIEELPNAN